MEDKEDKLRLIFNFSPLSFLLGNGQLPITHYLNLDDSKIIIDVDSLNAINVFQPSNNLRIVAAGTIAIGIVNQIAAAVGLEDKQTGFPRYQNVFRKVGSLDGGGNVV